MYTYIYVCIYTHTHTHMDIPWIAFWKLHTLSPKHRGRDSCETGGQALTLAAHKATAM